MALSPQISLQAGQGIPQFDPMGAAQKGLSLVDLMQQVQYRPQQIEQQLSTARTAQAGAELSNEKMRREENARRRLAELAKLHTTTGKDNVLRVNRDAAALQASQEGIDPDTLFAFIQGGAKSDQDTLKTEADRSALLTKRSDLLNEMISAQKDPARAMDIFKKGFASASLIVGPEKAKEYFSTYFDTDSLGDETVPPDAKGAKLIQNSLLNKQSKITALEKEDLALRQRQMALSELQVSPEYKERVSTIQGPDQRAGALVDAAETETHINTNNEGVRAAVSLNKLDTRPGAIVSSVWNRLVAQEPAARQLQASIDAYNLRNKTNMTIEDGIKAVVQTLEQENRVLGAKAKTKRAITTGGNLREAAATAPPGPTTEPPRATGKAPQRALDMLKANPSKEMKEAFRSKYGFLPQGM